MPRPRRKKPLSDEAIERLIGQRDLDTALAALEVRLTADAADTEALFYRGACAMIERRFAAAAEDFAAAATARPEEPRFLTAQAAASLADNKPEQALEYAEAALALAPDDQAALINQLQALGKLGRYAEGLPITETLLQIDGDLPEARQLKGDMLRGLNQLPAAIGCYQSALQLTPDDPRLKADIAVCLMHLGQYHAAMSAVADLIKEAPEDPDYFARLGIRVQEGGSPLLALQFFRHGFKLFPDDLTTCVNLGITVQGFGNPGESLFYFQRALALDETCAAAWFFSGVAHLALKFQDKAAACFRRCLELAPQHAEAKNHLAGLLKEQGKMDEAKQLLRDAIEHDPKWLSPYLGLYSFLKETGDFEEAEEVLDRADTIAPDNISLRQSRADLLMKRGDIRGANTIFREVLEKKPENPDAMSGLLFCSNYDPELTPTQIADAYKSWDERFVKGRAPPPDFRFANEVDPERRLKVGYVSGDFRGHSVAFFFEPILAHHNHSEFEIFCYANQRGGDPTTSRMLPMADHWRWVLDFSDEALVEMIRMDGIDILIDLSNHTAYHRLYMFGRKPAPIQMTWIGMPTTTGLSAIDWRITDARMDPEGMTEALHSEKLLRLVSGWCYRPSEEARIDPGETPALVKGHLTFASFNAFGKINPGVFRMWGRILNEIPDAELVVATGGKDDDETLNATVRRTCEECGVPLDRVRLMGRKPLKEYFEFHREVDVVLDPFPYNGGTVTAHALWMSVPVISLAGVKPIGRMGVSMLTSVGREDFVAASEDEYVAIAKRCADDIPRLADIRRALRPTMEKSPLMDGELVTRDLETAFRRIWQDWCKANKPKRKRSRKK